MAAVAAALAHTLSGCGSTPELGPGAIRQLTGLAPPAETFEDQEARGDRIVAAADSLAMSAVHGETSHPRLPAFVTHATCAGTRCGLFDPATGLSETAGVDDLFAADEELDRSAEAVGSRHGITLVSGTAHLDELDGAENVSFETYGAWMEHVGFSFQESAYEAGGISVVERFGMALGDLTGSKPGGGATWLGLIVGALATGDDAGDRLQGDAALNYDLDSDTLDVGFSSIMNIDRRAAHSTGTVTFTDLAIAPDGTFARGATGGRIQGGFYGPGHAEAAGVFGHSNIVGAFGAKRQE